MHPHLVFWISAIVRMLTDLGGEGVAGFFWGVVPAAGVGLVGRVRRSDSALPSSGDMPVGVGASLLRSDAADGVVVGRRVPPANPRKANRW